MKVAKSTLASAPSSPPSTPFGASSLPSLFPMFLARRSTPSISSSNISRSFSPSLTSSSIATCAANSRTMITYTAVTARASISYESRLSTRKKGAAPNCDASFKRKSILDLACWNLSVKSSRKSSRAFLASSPPERPSSSMIRQPEAKVSSICRRSALIDSTSDPRRCGGIMATSIAISTPVTVAITLFAVITSLSPTPRAISNATSAWVMAIYIPTMPEF
mmetsp:Transcript_34330/g.100975  ORF Transcript_34330/g.100975 Transcript_34330/m.100975 type:complete len:221 (-) Transcript_34330:463-1125(-)